MYYHVTKGIHRKTARELETILNILYLYWDDIVILVIHNKHIFVKSSGISITDISDSGFPYYRRQ